MWKRHIGSGIKSCGELEQGEKLALEEKLSASRDNLTAAEARMKTRQP